MEPGSWRQLTGHGPALIACLDFPGTRAAAGFADLAAAVPAAGTWLHLDQPGPGPLPASAARWAAGLTAAGRPVRAILGYCAGAALAAPLAAALTAAGPPPLLILLDAMCTTSQTLTSQYTLAVESSTRHLTPAELTSALALPAQLTADHPQDLPRIAAALAARYTQLISAVAARLNLHHQLRRELTTTFTAYMNYLLLTSQGRYTATAAPAACYLTSAGYQPPTPDTPAITLDTTHDNLLRDPRTHTLITSLLKGDQPW
jgi:thioesterase domain-containing protein